MHSKGKNAACGLVSGLLVLAAENALAQSIQWNPDSAPPAGPVITLDQADYEPGETAHISGTGFEPFETVSLRVGHGDGVADSGADHDSWLINADANGEIVSTWHVCEDDCKNSVLELRAIGNTSGRVGVVSFSDGFVTNGDFETTTLLGWSVARSAELSNGWYQYSGTVSPVSHQPINAPPQGTRAVVSDHLGGGFQYLYQDLVLEPGYQHLLTFKVYYKNWANVFYTPQSLSPVGLNQQYRVDIIRAGAAIDSMAPADLLATPFRTAAGDPAVLAPTLVTADLTPFAGSIVRLRFAVVQTVYYFNGSVDDVQLVSTPLNCLTLQCPADILLDADAGQCGALVNFPLPAAGGNCPPGEITVQSVPAPGSLFPVGTTTVHCTAQDAGGQTASCFFTVTVQDKESPTITLSPAATLHCNPTELEIAAAFGVASVSDNCTGDLTASGIIQPEEGTGCLRSVTKTWTATDAAGNIGAAAQTVTFLRDTAAPQILNLAGPGAPIALGNAATVSASFTDGCSGVETVVFNWGEGGAETAQEPGSPVAASHIYSAPGIYPVRVSVMDHCGNLAEEVFQYVVVYDPAVGSVTGGGWIDSKPGAYIANPVLTGKATFGFVAKYANGASIPTGQMQFHLRVAEFRFQSESYEWLVVSEGTAQFRGAGSVNGAGHCDFQVTLVDGQFGGASGIDAFRIKIWNETGVLYDNTQAGNAQEINQGSIVVRN